LPCWFTTPTRRTLLLPKPLAGVARHLVGFGVPAAAMSILETDDHEITLVFASRIRRDQRGIVFA
jgi:hypothetical protein